ncbi:ABC transporter substrate-binding protein [Ketogulonicigenium vulgare]|nr:ABC transporter substrate-binding protein [Ketogulonicigenium vulgare]
MRVSDAIMLVALSLWGGAVLADDAPRRVVSINLCTDQLALQLAAPGQLISVTAVARDAQVSPFADLAADISVNHGGAEEVFRLSPDLVLASDYTPIATLDLLRRLGLRVEQFAPEYSFDDIRTNTARMGALLGQDAGALIADFDAGLARISTPTRPIRAVIYGANGFASAGPGLPQAVLDAAGLQNAAAEVMAYSGTLPLERLIMLDPDMIITPTPYPGASNAEGLLRHPAMDKVRPGAGLAGNEWACGTTAVLRAVQRLAAAREGLE